jgi:flagellar hook-associated protein 2
MAIRMSGLISNLDTDSIIKELMTAKSAKKTKLEQQKTKLEWKQEKWADLNTKIYKLYTDQLSKVRLSGNYNTKKVISGNENLVTATATTAAGSGTHTIEIKSLASAQYITGAQVDNLKSSDTLASKGIAAGTIIRVTVGTGDSTVVKELEVKDGTSITDFVNTMKDAGLNASFDEGQGRFFISSKKTGQAGAFTIATYAADAGKAAALTTATDKLKQEAGLTDDQVTAYRALLVDLNNKQKTYDSVKDVTSWSKLQDTKQKVADMEEGFYKQKAGQEVISERLAELKLAANDENAAAYQDYKDVETAVQRSYYKLDADGKVMDPLEFTPAALSNAKSALRQQATATIDQKMKDGTLVYNDPDPAKNVAARNADIDAEYKRLYETYGATEEEGLNNKAKESYQKTLDSALSNAAKAYIATDAGAAKVTARAADLKAETGADSISGAVGAYKTALTDYIGTPVTSAPALLSNLGIADMKVDVSADGKTTTVSPVAGGPTGFILKGSTDAKVSLDGADMTVTGNTLTAAGVTYNLKGAQVGTTVSINVTNDSQSVYDMIKGFIKGYNDILGEMNTLYNADSAKGYEPLTDDQKQAMSDKQIELWEDKIKDSLLRRDDSLDSVINTFRTSLQGGITIGGKNYTLASLGIVTGSYTEKGLLHIEGDSEDAAYSSKTNKLMDALSSNPEAAANALSGIFGQLSSGLQDKMKSTSLNSALTFYNDKEMKSQVTQYTKDIKDWTTKLQDIEDRYYKQFSAMETALAKIQSSTKSLTNLIGG